MALLAGSQRSGWQTLYKPLREGLPPSQANRLKGCLGIRPSVKVETLTLNEIPENR